MSMMKPDEMQILKATAIKLSDDVILIATYQNHTETDPATGKKDRRKSQYRWLARVCDVHKVRAAVKEMFSDEHRLEPWVWPNDPSWPGKIVTSDSTKYWFAKWLNIRLNKAVEWEDGMKIFDGDRFLKGEINPGATYVTDGYKADNGDIVSLRDREALLKHVGQNLWRPQYLKTQPHPDNF